MTQYTHTTWAAWRQQLAARLNDAGKLYWVDDELATCLSEALRTWQALTGYWRDRQTFALAALAPFYDIPSALPSLLAYTVTDRDLVGAIQYHLLEPKNTAGWSGTEMWTLDDLTQALQRQRNQLLVDSACRLVRDNTTYLVAAGASRVDLADTVIDIRRAAWVAADGTVTVLRRSDTHIRGSLGISGLSPGTPRVYSIASEKPLRLELIPAPSNTGTLDLLLVQTGADLSPSTTPTVLGVPDDYSWIIKWGALADLLSKDGAGRDAQRAAYCRKRYDEAVDLLRTMPMVVGCEVNGVPVLTAPLASLDGTPNWQTTTGTPRVVALSGNILAVYPVLPNDGSAGSVTLDVMRNAPIPATDGEYVQLGREQLDAVLGYAEHLALFKQGGANFYFATRLYNDFIGAATVYNERLAAISRNRETVNKQSAADTGPNPPRWKRGRDVELQ